MADAGRSMTPDSLPPLPPPPPRTDSWGMAPPLPAPPQGRGMAEESLDAPSVTVVKGGRRYQLASRDWAWGVWDQQTRSWVRWFEGERTRDRAWLLWDRLENHDGIHFWRRVTPLWITLHIILGFVGMGFVVASLAIGSPSARGTTPRASALTGSPWPSHGFQRSEGGSYSFTCASRSEFESEYSQR